MAAILQKRLACGVLARAVMEGAMASCFLGSRCACAWITVLAACACSASADDTGGFGGGSGGSGSDTTGSGAQPTGSGGSGGSISVGTGGTGTGGAGACTQNVDIVFTMDVSTSMGGFLSKLADEMPVVDAAVKALNLQSTPHYGLVVFVDDTLFVNSATPYQDVAKLQQDFESWASFTSLNTQVSGNGYNTTFPENSLDALYDAATKFPWRPAEQTLRIVIHTTDDTFWNGPTFQDGVSIAHGYTDTVQALQQAQVRVFAFAAHFGGPDEIDDVSSGWFGPYTGQKAIPEATGGGVFNIEDVMSGQISLSASINQAVKNTFCEPYPPPR
jgi:hypothetical protein